MSYSGLPEGATYKGRGMARETAPAEAYARLKEETKLCVRCGERKPRRHFYASSKALLAYCKSCDKERRRPA